MQLQKSKIVGVIALFTLWGAHICRAQNSGSFMGNNIRYYYEGISPKKVSVKVEGKDLKTNKVPLGKYVDFLIASPQGFLPDAHKKYFVGAEVLYINAAKKIIFQTKNIFSDFETKGFTKEALANMKISINLRPELVKNNNQLNILIRIYDLKSERKMRFIFDVDIIAAIDNNSKATTGQAINRTTQTTETTNAAPAPQNHKIDASFVKANKLNGLNIKSIEVSVDHSIRVAPNMAYLSIEMFGITGSSLPEITSGTCSFTVYNENNIPLLIKDKLLKKIKGSMEGDVVDFTVKIPFKVKNISEKKYKVMFVWSNSQKTKLIEIISTK